MKVSTTYDDTLYQLVPKEPDKAQLAAMRFLKEAPVKTDKYGGAYKLTIDEDASNRARYAASLSSAPTPPAQPEAHGSVWTLIAPDGAKFTGPSPGKAAIEASKHHMETDPEAREKFLRAVKQIADEGRQEREQCMHDYGTLDCPHCGGSGHIADAVANGFPPPAQPAERMPLTDVRQPFLCLSPVCGPTCCECNCAISPQDQLKYAKRYAFLRNRDLDSIKSGGVFAGMTPSNVVLNGDDLDAEIDGSIEAAHGITAPKEPS